MVNYNPHITEDIIPYPKHLEILNLLCQRVKCFHVLFLKDPTLRGSGKRWSHPPCLPFHFFKFFKYLLPPSNRFHAKLQGCIFLTKKFVLAEKIDTTFQSFELQEMPKKQKYQSTFCKPKNIHTHTRNGCHVLGRPLLLITGVISYNPL